ncbi:MFS-type transporter SLC18B1 [Aplysia californica]|uniref:MFS-type transporter SLC18B1 n=1 Tax=Aplysia californica TaxID=6500 RepID=A0ABM1VY19_APLCA|nr:MFS-type transporter SLC18B1 [Aplysia californica]XP_005104785.1 MFS-type transporter SLC18B1 [Aplysia californica]XP_035827312.1 MFS-type transporter SLC18B1 [Aplysia californica]
MSATAHQREKSPLLGSDHQSGSYSRDDKEVNSVQGVEAGSSKASTGAAAEKDGAEGTNGTEPEEPFSIRALSNRKKYTMVMMALANLFTGCGFSLIAPFFPQEASKKGVSTTVTGIIFSVFEFVIFITSPVYGNFLTRIGPKFMFLSGTMVGGTCAILFGLLDKCPPGTPFIVMCFLCRCIEALGLSAYVTASFAIISNEFPKHIATVFGILETANGIGLMLGPAVGGGLYELGGYGVPFFVIGTLIILNGLFLSKFLPPPQNFFQKRKGSVFGLLRSPMVLIAIVTILAGACGIAFLDPTLAKHLDKFKLSTGLVGLVFVVVPGLYGITAPLWGYISDSKNIQAPLLILGNLVCGVGYLFVGPAPFLPFIPFELWSVILGLVFVGFCIGCAVVPTMKCLVIGAQEIGFEDNLDTYGIVSGLFNSLFCLGAFVGPTLGSTAVEQLGFDWAAVIVSCIHFAAMICVVIYFTLRRIRRKADNGPEAVSHYTSLPIDENDRQALLDPEVVLSHGSLSSVSSRSHNENVDRRRSNPTFMRSVSHPSV